MPSTPLSRPAVRPRSTRRWRCAVAAITLLTPAVGAAADAPGTTGNSRTTVATPNRARSVEALSRRLQRWVADPDPIANAQAIARVQRGVPPGALVAFLVAVRDAPRPIFAAVVQQCTRYRRMAVRGYALAAMAALDPSRAGEAVALAADDRELGIRRLALTLAQQHPTPAAEAVIARLLARDRVLAEERIARAELVPEPAAPDEVNGAGDEAKPVDKTDAQPIEETVIVVDDEDDAS